MLYWDLVDKNKFSEHRERIILDQLVVASNLANTRKVPCVYIR
jgi:hypothetical protein